MNVIWLSLLSILSTSIAPPPDFTAYAGNYRLAANEVIAIAEWELDPSSPHVLAFTNLKTGRIGVLTELGGDEFALSAGLLAGSQVASVRFVRSGNRVIALIYAPSSGPSLRAQRVDTRREDVSIDAGDVRLAGTLFLPEGRGPFPAIVIVPAGAVGRTASATFPNFFVAEGFAVLVYDRRPDSAPFTTYAADAVATVEHLRRRTDVDARNVGLSGHSQGGFLSLVAAAESPAVSFVIDHSGMLLPAWQQDLYRLAAEARADGVAPDDVAKAVEFEARLMTVAANGQGWPGVAETMRANSQASWMELVYKPKSLDELQRVWRNDFSFDPRPFAARVRQPVLALFGGLDKSTPIESAANLANAMRQNDKLTIEFFPTANHALLEAKTGGNAEIPALSHFAPGMFETMHRWLRAKRVSIHSSPISKGPNLAVTPGTALVDQPVRIRVTGVRPASAVTIRAQTSLGRQGALVSEAVFTADARGTVDVATSAPQRGSYQGVDPMGLFWAMRLDTAIHMTPAAMNPWAPPAPYEVKLDLLVDSVVVAHSTVLRQFLAPTVRRLDVNGDGIVGHFYLPARANGTRAPLVIVLSGSEGGFDDMRASMLASHGFATLALAYFKAPGLPEELFEIPIETVERAVKWAGRQSAIDASRIGIMGASKGAELALVAASLIPELHAVVGIAATDVVAQGIDRNGRSRATSSWTWRGRPLPFLRQVPPPEFTEQFNQHGPPYRLRILHEASRRDTASLNAAKIAVERIQGPVLLISGDDDQLGPSAEGADAAVARWKSARTPYPIEHLRYEHAGHQILLPFLPTPPRNGGQFWAMGGTDLGYAQADLGSWSRTLEFLQRSLGDRSR